MTEADVVLKRLAPEEIPSVLVPLIFPDQFTKYATQYVGDNNGWILTKWVGKHYFVCLGCLSSTGEWVALHNPLTRSPGLDRDAWFQYTLKPDEIPAFIVDLVLSGEVELYEPGT